MKKLHQMEKVHDAPSFCAVVCTAAAIHNVPGLRSWGWRVSACESRTTYPLVRADTASSI